MAMSKPILLITVATSVLVVSMFFSFMYTASSAIIWSPVHQLAAFVRGDNAVGIAVKGKAHIRTQLLDQLAEPLGMGGTAQIVDVGTIGLMVIRADLRAQFLEHSRGHIVGRAVGAVQHNMQAVQPYIKRALNKVNVAPCGR